MTVVPFNAGQEANLSRDALEAPIEREFANRRIPIFGYTEDGGNHDLFCPKKLVRGVPFISIYGTPSKTGFVYYHDPLDAVRIECKWQQVSGSIDEKFPYMLLNAVHAMPERVIWFVLDGGGAKKAAIEWLGKESAKVTTKLVRTMNLSEARTNIKQLIERGIG